MGRDEQEQAALCRRVAPRLVGSLTLYCGDRWLAEECAQEALARAIERWPEVAAMAAPEAWVYKTAFNVARSVFRRARVEHQARLREPPPAPLPDAADAVALRAAVLALAPRQREVIVARFYLGLDVDTTARLVGCRPGTVKAHTFKALARLRAAGYAHNAEERMDGLTH